MTRPDGPGTYSAFLSGLSTMRWSRFLVANAAGGVLWSDTYAFGAYALGNAASSIGSTITIVGLAVAGVLLNAPNSLTSCTSGRRQVCSGRTDGPDLCGTVAHRPAVARRT
jgi:hypothetical protein